MTMYVRMLATTMMYAMSVRCNDMTGDDGVCMVPCDDDERGYGCCAHVTYAMCVRVSGAYACMGAGCMYVPDNDGGYVRVTMSVVRMITMMSTMVPGMVR